MSEIRGRSCIVAFAAFALIAHTARAGERPWNLIRGSHVTIVGQQSPKTLRQIAVEIEQFRFTLGAAIHGAAQPPAMPTVVYTFDDRKALEPFVPLYRGRPAALGGYCLCGGTADANLIVASLAGYADASAIIFHEYTHLLIRNAASAIPVWLNEGLAEYYSTFRLTDHDRRAEIGRPIEHHVALLRTQLIPVDDLVRVNQSSPLYNEGDRRSVFYAEAWALTHYLLTERPNGAVAVNAFVNALAHGVAPDTAFAHAFGATPADMTTLLKQYIGRPVFKSTMYVLNHRVEVDEPEHAEVLPRAEADARLGRIQVRLNRADEAAPRIEAAAAAAGDNAEAQFALALLRLHQQKPDEARAPLEKAVALAPNDFVTQYVYGLLLLRDTIDTPQGGPDSAAASDKRELAHAALTRAVAANPQSADALAWQAYADLVAGVRLEEARDAMRRAIELAPGQQDYRVRLAQIEARIAARQKPVPRDLL
jgi:tetratricopeptide (TPR) repeat protein